MRWSQLSVGTCFGNDEAASVRPQVVQSYLFCSGLGWGFGFDALPDAGSTLVLATGSAATLCNLPLRRGWVLDRSSLGAAIELVGVLR